MIRAKIIDPAPHDDVDTAADNAAADKDAANTVLLLIIMMALLMMTKMIQLLEASATPC